MTLESKMRLSLSQGLVFLSIVAPAVAGFAQPIPPRSTTPPTDPGVHPVVYAFHRGFRGPALDPAQGVRPDELALFDAIVRTGTAPGSRSRLAFVAADRAARFFAPLALAAVGRNADAARLRALAPVSNAATAHAAAAACEAVRQALFSSPDIIPYQQPGGTLLAMMLAAAAAASNAESSLVDSPTAEREAAEAGQQAGQVAFIAQWLLRGRRPESERASTVAAAIQLLTDLTNAARAPQAAPGTRGVPARGARRAR